MNISEILRSHATTSPASVAIVDTFRSQRRTTTFAQLESASARAAALLAQAGLRPGDIVLVLQPMSAELYITLSAIFRLGLVAMFVDPGQGRAQLERCCALCPPSALIGSTKAHLLRLVAPALRRIPHKFVIGTPWPGAVSWQRADQLSPHQGIYRCSPDTPALLTFTSGSTGQPKAALRTHGFLLAQHRALANSLRLRTGDIDLTTMPIVTLANLASGVTSLIPDADLRYPGRIKPAPVVAQIRTEGVTSTVASPALLEQLVNYCLARKITLFGLEKIFTGGAPVFPRLLQQLQQIAPQADVVAVYGSTEAEPMAEIAYGQLSSEDMQRMRQGAGLLVGRPVDSLHLRIVADQWGKPLGPYCGEDFATQCCEPDRAGEIVVSGDHVLAGYVGGRGDEETKFRVGDTIWHRTGDAGYLDAQGRLWLLGRCAARLDDGNGLLYPFTVECAASFQPGIRRAAVASLAGRRILAVVPDAAAEANLATLKDALAWAHLDEIRALMSLPVDKRHNAKIDYPAFRQMLTRLTE